VALVVLLCGSSIASAQPTFPPSDYLVLSEAQEHLLWQMVGPQNSSPGVARSGFKASFDARVPKSVVLHPMPKRVVAQLPTLEAYKYAIAGQNLLVVNPLDNTIVDVITPPATATTASQ
jgi:hypothetical protein